MSSPAIVPASSGRRASSIAMPTALARPGSVFTRKNASPVSTAVTNSRNALRRFSSDEGVPGEVPFEIA